MSSETHEYLPSSTWTGESDYPRWAACRGCRWSGPTRTTWASAEADYDAHLTTAPAPAVDSLDGGA